MQLLGSLSEWESQLLSVLLHAPSGPVDHCVWPSLRLSLLLAMDLTRLTSTLARQAGLTVERFPSGGGQGLPEAASFARGPLRGAEPQPQRLPRRPAAGQRTPGTALTCLTEAPCSLELALAFCTGTSLKRTT